VTADQTRILELFRALRPDEKEALLPRLAEAASEPEFNDLSAADIAAIADGVAQAEGGEVVEADEVLDRIAARYRFARA
jgi:predicted transcriptional regulator